MGLLQAGIGALSSVLAVSGGSISTANHAPDVLVTKGAKRVSAKSSNTRASENIISDARNRGQRGPVHDGRRPGRGRGVLRQAGGICLGQLRGADHLLRRSRAGARESWETLKNSFTMGGDTGRDQRVYFFNTKELPATSTARQNRCVPGGRPEHRARHGYRHQVFRRVIPIKSPIHAVLRKRLRERRSRLHARQLDSHAESELLTALQPPSRDHRHGHPLQRPAGHAEELAKALNELLSEKMEQPARRVRRLLRRELRLGQSRGREDNQGAAEKRRVRNPTMRRPISSTRRLRL